jgi:hypothetical protein
LGGYIIIVVGTLFWSFSGASDNALGAQFGHERLQAVDRDIYFVQNTGSSAWTKVRIVMDKRYLYKVDKVDKLSRVTLQANDFAYFYHIPRTWGVRDWELLAATDKHASNAPRSHSPSLIQIRAYEGSLDIEIADGVQRSAQKGERKDTE